MKRFLLGLFSLCLLVACDPPSQHDPVRYGEVKVWLGPGWLNYDRQRIEQQLTYLHRLGPAFSLTTDQDAANVLLYRFESPNCELFGAGRWFQGSRRVEIDPVCTQGDTVFRMTVGHEIGHVLGMGHVCLRDREVPNCSPVGYGQAMMNPFIWERDDAEFWVAQEEPTELDLAEFRRVRR
jgi:hypothetical protein